MRKPTAAPTATATPTRAAVSLSADDATRVRLLLQSCAESRDLLGRLDLDRYAIDERARQVRVKCLTDAASAQAIVDAVAKAHSLDPTQYTYDLASGSFVAVP